jgi:5-methyltetrahydrofolate--homocysteine methyltransferase
MSDLDRLVVIGENLHATRIVRRSDARLGLDEQGRESVIFTDAAGTTRHLLVTDEERASATYAEGKIKHVRVAIRSGMRGGGPEASTALAYLESVVRNQLDNGAHYLDVNVDEVSLDLGEQIEAMRWLVAAVRSWTSAPVAIDSPNVDVLSAGIEQAEGGDGLAPMVNSASLERPGPLDLAVRTGGPLVVTAAGESGMPNDADGRIDNATRIVERALERGIALDRIYVDPLVFPISVDGASGLHCLEAYGRLRARFGPEIHLTGGISNVSFGLPHRRLLNDAFLLLAIDTGCDSGILDPVASPPERLAEIDRDSPPFRLAADVLTGADPGCRAFLKAYRAGELDPVDSG